MAILPCNPLLLFAKKKERENWIYPTTCSRQFSIAINAPCFVLSLTLFSPEKINVGHPDLRFVCNCKVGNILVNELNFKWQFS
jgi:hypothetical protein